MSSGNYDSFKDLQTGNYDYKVRARVIRLWRGATRTGEVFKNFNVLLLDNKVFFCFYTLTDCNIQSYQLISVILLCRATEFMLSSQLRAMTSLQQYSMLAKFIRYETSLSSTTNQQTNTGACVMTNR